MSHKPSLYPMMPKEPTRNFLLPKTITQLNSTAFSELHGHTNFMCRSTLAKLTWELQGRKQEFYKVLRKHIPGSCVSKVTSVPHKIIK